MTVNELILTCKRMVAGKKLADLSDEMALQYLSEEMSFCASIFPQRVTFEHTVTVAGDEQTIDGLSDVKVTEVRYNDLKLQQVRDTAETVDMLAIGYYGYWTIRGGVLKLLFDAVVDDVLKVYGHLARKTYTSAEGSFEIVAVVISPITETLGLIGAPLRLVRYCIQQRIAEDVGDFEKAQYFFAAGKACQADLVTTYEPIDSMYLDIVSANDNWNG